MEQFRMVRITDGEFAGHYGVVKGEENGTLNCLVSGPHFNRGQVKVLASHTTEVEDLREGRAQFTIDNLVFWLRDRVQQAGAKGCVVGISGGIDSAVVSALCKRAFPNAALGMIMPCHSIPEDRHYAEMVCKAIDLPYHVMDLSAAFDQMVSTAKQCGVLGEEHHPLTVGNLKARLRMSSLYLAAQARGYLVIGTDNAAETVTGYFTKYGDGGVDLLPISSLLKRQVRELASYLGIPEPIIAKPPSAGLYAGQTDESEMGIRYEDIDDYIAGFPVDEKVKAKIQAMEERSQHKRELPPASPAEMNILLKK